MKKESLLFWKKEAKNFCVAVAELCPARDSRNKSFWFFFFKEELLAFSSRLPHAGNTTGTKLCNFLSVLTE